MRSILLKVTLYHSHRLPYMMARNVLKRVILVYFQNKVVNLLEKKLTLHTD